MNKRNESKSKNIKMSWFGTKAGINKFGIVIIVVCMEILDVAAPKMASVRFLSQANYIQLKIHRQFFTN